MKLGEVRHLIHAQLANRGMSCLAISGLRNALTLRTAYSSWILVEKYQGWVRDTYGGSYPEWWDSDDFDHMDERLAMLDQWIDANEDMDISEWYVTS